VSRRRFLSGTIVDGRQLRDAALSCLRGRIQALLVSPGELGEAEQTVALPDDDRLHLMLESAMYSLGALPRDVRLPVKRVAASVAARLV